MRSREDYVSGQMISISRALVVLLLSFRVAIHAWCQTVHAKHMHKAWPLAPPERNVPLVVLGLLLPGSDLMLQGHAISRHPACACLVQQWASTQTGSLREQLLYWQQV